MRILMLGNSFIYFHQMPSMLAELTGAEVVANTRGGAKLAWQLDPETDLGARTLAALQNETWDYVVLQDKSNAPIKSRRKFLWSMAALCDMARQAQATPVLYATWPYRRGSEKLLKLGISYEEMASGLFEAYHEAARLNHALIADVGLEFDRLCVRKNLYAEDGFHPNRSGSRLAAETIAAVIMTDYKKKDREYEPH